MKKNILYFLASFLLAAILLPAPARAANRDDGMQPARGFYLPEGSPSAGKKAFERLKCFTCHAVEKGGFPAPTSEKPGPELGEKQAGYAPGWILNSIVSPSHTIAWNSDGTAKDSELSRMGDFTEIMTVREMLDLVTYIRSFGWEEEEQAK